MIGRLVCCWLAECEEAVVIGGLDCCGLAKREEALRGES